MRGAGERAGAAAGSAVRGVGERAGAGIKTRYLRYFRLFGRIGDEMDLKSRALPETRLQCQAWLLTPESGFCRNIPSFQLLHKRRVV